MIMNSDQSKPYKSSKYFGFVSSRSFQRYQWCYYRSFGVSSKFFFYFFFLSPLCNLWRGKRDKKKKKRSWRHTEAPVMIPLVLLERSQRYEYYDIKKGHKQFCYRSFIVSPSFFFLVFLSLTSHFHSFYYKLCQSIFNFKKSRIWHLQLASSKCHLQLSKLYYFLNIFLYYVILSIFLSVKSIKIL